MKVYLTNKTTNESEEVKLSKTTDGYSWVSASSNTKLMDCMMMNELPSNIELIFDAQEDRERIGEKLRKIREEKHITMRQMEMLAGILHQNISKNENGKTNQSVEVISKLANALGYKLALVPIDL